MENAHVPSTRLERKTIEKKRRMHMKELYSKLESLLPPSPHANEGKITLPDRIDEAISYTKGLQQRIERMKERKRQLVGTMSNIHMDGDQGLSGFIRSMPKLEVHDLGSGGLKVVMMSVADDRGANCDVLEALEEGGMQILDLNFAVVGHRAFHTIHAMGAGARPLNVYEWWEILMNKITYATVRMDVSRAF